MKFFSLLFIYSLTIIIIFTLSRQINDTLNYSSLTFFLFVCHFEKLTDLWKLSFKARDLANLPQRLCLGYLLRWVRSPALSWPIPLHQVVAGREVQPFDTRRCSPQPYRYPQIPREEFEKYGKKIVKPAKSQVRFYRWLTFLPHYFFNE